MSDANEGRVYVRRRGRMTAAQARAVETLWDRYVLTDDVAPDVVLAPFERDRPLGIEIGFGMGRELVRWALERPDWNLLGIEVYRPGIGALLNAAEENELGNLRVVEGEAVRWMRALADESVAEVRVLFPDPWPKKRHHRRRLVNAAFLDLLERILSPDGKVLIATDWQPYAEVIAGLFEDHGGFRGERRDRAAAGADRLTPFERKGLAQGHRVSDFVFRRVDKHL